MKTKLIFALATLIIITLGCKKKIQEPSGTRDLDGFRFVLIKNNGENQVIINNPSQSVVMWHTADYSSNYLNTRILPALISGQYQYFVNTANATLLSLKNGVKNFYIKVDGAKVDTLHLNIVDEDGKFIYKEVKFNGKPVLFDNTQSVWILKQ